MTITLTSHAAELLEAIRLHRPEPIELLLEQALEIFASAPEAGRPSLPTPEATSVLELQGLGKELWQEIDAQAYVNNERAAWNG